VREHMAALGVARLSDIIGRTQYLQPGSGTTERQGRIDLSRILSQGDLDDSVARYCTVPSNKPFDRGLLAEKMVSDCLPSIETKTSGQFSYTISNVNRSIGARLSGEIAKRHGDQGMADTPLDITLSGTAGQSFGVWNAGGLHLRLEGDANDYAGKGMAGGKIVIRPPQNSHYDRRDSPIVGNTCLYGATGGTFYAAGTAGERFAVRNSGAVAVVEGTGDHACEYMTGGCVVVLGETGINFGAGMTGGLGYVFDPNNVFVDRYNHELIDIHRLHSESMERYRNYLQSLIEDYIENTGSEWGRTLIDEYYSLASRFWMVKPKASELSELIASLENAA